VSLGSALTAGYDGDGLRAWKNNGTATTFFLYDGIEPVCELDASGGVTATNTFGAHGLVSRAMSAGSTFYTFDPQGGVAQRLTSADTVTDTDAYNAWGSRTSTGGGDVFGYGAQWGYVTDSETGLILCGHRCYDPARGRWLTRDPIGYAGGIGLYEYCQDEPEKWADFSGFEADTSPEAICTYGGGGLAAGGVLLDIPVLITVGSVIVVIGTVIYIIDVISSLPVTPNPPGDYVPPGPGPTQIDPYGGPPGNYPLP